LLTFLRMYDVVLNRGATFDLIASAGMRGGA